MGASDTNEVSVDVTNTAPFRAMPSRRFTFISATGRRPGQSGGPGDLSAFPSSPARLRLSSFPLGRGELQFWSPQKKQWVVEPSEFDARVGEDWTASLHADFTVTQ